MMGSPPEADPDGGTPARLKADGTVWFAGGTWNDQYVMRISVINWSTREPDVDAAVSATRRALAASRAAG
jgi:hypothetical protein